MPNIVIISSLAEKELQVSFDWYEEQQTGLGERFLNQIEAAIESVTKQKKQMRKLLVLLILATCLLPEATA